MSENIPKVYAAISAVMERLSKEGIAKDKKNTQQGYKFRGIDDVYNALAPHLSAAKLLILPRVLSRSVTERETKNGGALFYVVLDVEFDFVSAEDGSKHVVKVSGEAMDSGDKATNKAMSAAYKYACMEAFCIPTEGENDADAATHEVAARKHDPKGDDHKLVDEKARDAVVNKFMTALVADKDELVIADDIYEIHLDLIKDAAMYNAVWSQIGATDRRAIKGFIELAKVRAA